MDRLTKLSFFVVLMLLATNVFAATDVVVEDYYRTETVYDPYSEQVCREVVVGGDRTKDTVKGAVIGGAIGNAIGKNTESTAAGIIIGGMIGHHDSDAVPHVRMSCTTETKYRTSTNKIYDYSTVTFTQNGKRYTARFVKR